LDSLERVRGHFLNWYDTRTLAPLLPRYISTVDSGNLAACLLVLKQGCLDAKDTPVIQWPGLVDTLNMLAEIDGLPDQLQQAWDLGATQPLSKLDAFAIRAIVISGMGGSAIGADLVSAFVSSSIRVPVIVHRDYGLPAFAHGKQTLVICSSHSGNTEETLDSFESALKNNCNVIAVCTGGELAKRADGKNVPIWRFSHNGQLATPTPALLRVRHRCPARVQPCQLGFAGCEGKARGSTGGNGTTMPSWP
jgi:hypothetical protein